MSEHGCGTGAELTACGGRGRLANHRRRLSLAAVIVCIAGWCAGAIATPAATLARPAGPSGARAAAGPAGPQVRATLPVDANTASAAELERVRGIGPALAARIVAARTSGGPFREPEDLRRRVRGVGEANLRRMIASGLVLSGAARIVPAKAAARERVDLVVGNVPAKSEARSLGRIEEISCCDPGARPRSR